MGWVEASFLLIFLVVAIGSFNYFVVKMAVFNETFEIRQDVRRLLNRPTPDTRPSVNVELEVGVERLVVKRSMKKRNRPLLPDPMNSKQNKGSVIPGGDPGKDNTPIAGMGLKSDVKFLHADTDKTKPVGCWS